MFGSIVIRYGSVDFGGERVEEESAVSDFNTGAPFAGRFDVIDAFVFRGRFGFLFSSILDILGVRGGETWLKNPWKNE